MEDVDIQETSDRGDEDLFLENVIAGEHELLFLDSYLREAFAQHARGIAAEVEAGSAGQAAGSAAFSDGDSV